MRTAGWIVWSCLVLAACNEGPRCALRGTPPRETVQIECNAGKVPICGMDTIANYQGPDDPSPGALAPVPTSEDGRCPEATLQECFVGDLDNPPIPCETAGENCDSDRRCRPNCRTRPICGEAGQGPTCADGTSPVCVLGVVEEIEPPRPMVDAGMPIDAGMTMTDAGMADAGMTDAGPDAGM